MASSKGPYYTSSVQSLTTGDVNGTSETGYPDLESSIIASSAQMYSLANGALHAHQSSTQSQLEGLLQAATVAASEESHYAGEGFAVSARLKQKSQLLCHNHPVFEPDQVNPSLGTGCSTNPDHSHGSVSSLLDNPNCPNSYASPSPAPRKRRRVNGSAPQLPKSSVDGPEQTSNTREASLLAAASSSPLRNAFSDAKTAEIHSTAALFRSPSSSSKKYTRPPMSKLYASLELSPENFLRLQASAKGYMLNNAYPDRRDCVGQRGKGDSELVRLKLWNCVRDFLDHEGHGNSFFGVEARGEDGKTRSMIWPNDKNRIIGAVTPLLRRMVTNERQRQYAVETRRDGGTGEAKQTGNALKQLHKDQDFSTSDQSESQKLCRGLYTEYIGVNCENEDFQKELKARNLGSRLDNLKCISGLPEMEFDRVIASVNHGLCNPIGPVLDEQGPTKQEEYMAQMIETGRAWGQGFSGCTGDKSPSYVKVPSSIVPKLTFK
ncbi:hypothetical protein MMC07_004688 [Pseudocyphellaria aurata]|nr:hypothetical protein [Pseudocyphellaria aurata]